MKSEIRLKRENMMLIMGRGRHAPTSTTTPEQESHPTKEDMPSERIRKEKSDSHLVFPVHWHHAIFVSGHCTKISQDLLPQAREVENGARQYAYQTISLMSIRATVQLVVVIVPFGADRGAENPGQARTHRVTARRHSFACPPHPNACQRPATAVACP